MTSGKFIMQGNKMGTTYPESGDAMWDLIEDFYANQYQFAKSAGAAVYTGDKENGYTNAIYGKYITAGMFMSDNAFTALGAKPYQHEGVRIATELATYGTCTEADIQAGLTGFQPGEFIGLGATTVQDGVIPGSVRMPVGEFREPAKELPMKFNYGLYLSSIENKDDVIAKKDYLDKIAKNYSDAIDKTLLRPIEKKQPVFDGVETSLNGIARVVSGYNESKRVVGDEALGPERVTPYGGSTAGHGDFWNYRSVKETNLDSQIVDAGGNVLSLDHLRKLYTQCSVNWADSAAPNNKVFLMSNIAQDKTASLLQANQRYMDTVYVQRDFNGVKTIPGRDGGLVLKSYNNIPILQDGNINYDYQKGKVSTTTFGDMFLLDLDHLWMSILSPVELHSVNNPAITNILQEVNVIHMRAELRSDGFIGSGKIVGVGDNVPAKG